MNKYLLSTLALSFALSAGSATTALAQGRTKTKSDDEKTKVKEDGMTTKTKVEDDGKVKVKAEAADGSKLKSKTKPREGEKGHGMSNASMGASAGVMVGGAMMTPDKDIVDNAVNSSEHTTLVAAVKAAGLVETMKGAGPFTVFAPTNAAFDKLPAGTVNTLVMPENKQKLTTILTYHVVPGRLMANDLKDGQTLTTVEGETLMVHRKGNTVMLHDAKGGMANVTIANVVSSNGVTHVIDAVLMPTK